jgi:chemotaxis regulatin CheY-phosphate phosphatase CheZ
MSEGTFRIVMAAAVLIAGLAFVVQAGIVFALYGLTRKMKSKATGFMEDAGPVPTKVKPMLDHVAPVIERIEPTLDSITGTAARIGSAIDRCRPVVDKTIVVVERAGGLIQSANELAATTHQIMQDVRLRIRDLSNDVNIMVRSGRAEVGRVRDLLHDVGARARARLKQINHTLDTNVHQIQSDSGTVLRRAHEVNGIVAAVSAAVRAVRSPKRSMASATQDEDRHRKSFPGAVNERSSVEV